MLLTKEVETGWCSTNKAHYENLGHKYEWCGRFTVAVEELPRNSHIKVEVKCDYCGETKTINYQVYNNTVYSDGTYKCQQCKSRSKEKIDKANNSKLKNSMSFEQWCTANNRQDILERWDFSKNTDSPSNIGYATSKKYWFLCYNKVHSQLRQISYVTKSTDTNYCKCVECDNFESWCIRNNKINALERWDYILNKKNQMKYHIHHKQNIILNVQGEFIKVN